MLARKLREHLDDAQWQRHVELKEQLQRIDRELKALPPREQILALAKSDPQPPPTHLMFRGNPHVPAEEVGLAFPALFGEPAPETPVAGPDARSAGRRRILADGSSPAEHAYLAGDGQPGLAAPLRPRHRALGEQLWRAWRRRRRIRSCSTAWLAAWSLTDWQLKPLHRLIMTSQRLPDVVGRAARRSGDRSAKRAVLAVRHGG